MNDNELQDLQASVDNAVAALNGLKERIEKAVLTIGGQRQDNERLTNDLASIRGERDEQFVRAQEMENQIRQVTMERDGHAGTIEELQNQIDQAAEQQTIVGDEEKAQAQEKNVPPAGEEPTEEIEADNPVANPATRSTGSKKGNEKQA